MRLPSMKSAKRSKGHGLRFFAISSAGLLGLLILALFGIVIAKGAERLDWTFLTEAPRGEILGMEGGIGPAILGSLAFTGTALLIAIPLAFALALLICFEIRDERIKRLLRAFVQLCAGLPSIVLGLFAYSLLVRKFALGRSVLAAAGGLAVMILPYIEQKAEKAFLEMPSEPIQGARALGCSRRYTILHLILPCCSGELLSAVLQGAAYAMGATAPLILTGGVAYASAPTSLLEPAMALPLHLYLMLAQGPPSFTNAYATAAVMLILTLLLSLLASYLSRKKQRWKQS